MITPQDIQDKEFGRGVRGYKEDEVDEFLDALTLQLEAMNAEMTKLKEDLSESNSKLEAYKTQEGSLISTLETAKSLMDDIAKSAEKRADILIRNAEIEADSILKQAKEKLDSMRSEEAILTERLTAFKNRYKSMLEAELSQFEDFSKESEIYKKEKESQAQAEFNDLLKSVEKKNDDKQDFFEDKAFNTLQDEFSKTIISMRKEIGE